MNKKGFAPSILVLVMVGFLVVISGTLYFNRSRIDNELPYGDDTLPAPYTLTNKKWTLFYNKKYGLKFKHPPNLAINENALIDRTSDWQITFGAQSDRTATTIKSISIRLKKQDCADSPDTAFKEWGDQRYAEPAERLTIGKFRASSYSYKGEYECYECSQEVLMSPSNRLIICNNSGACFNLAISGYPDQNKDAEELRQYIRNNFIPTIEIDQSFESFVCEKSKG